MLVVLTAAAAPSQLVYLFYLGSIFGGSNALGGASPRDVWHLFELCDPFYLLLGLLHFSELDESFASRCLTSF